MQREMLASVSLGGCECTEKESIIAHACRCGLTMLDRNARQRRAESVEVEDTVNEREGQDVCCVQRKFRVGARESCTAWIDARCRSSVHILFWNEVAYRVNSSGLCSKQDSARSESFAASGNGYKVPPTGGVASFLSPLILPFLSSSCLSLSG